MTTQWDFTETLELEIEVSVEVRIKGYAEAAQVNGPPDRCYPAEGESEVEVIAFIFKTVDGGAINRVTEEAAGAIAWAFLTNLFESEIDRHADIALENHDHE